MSLLDLKQIFRVISRFRFYVVLGCGLFFWPCAVAGTSDQPQKKSASAFRVAMDAEGKRRALLALCVMYLLFFVFFQHSFLIHTVVFKCVLWTWSESILSVDAACLHTLIVTSLRKNIVYVL